MQKRELWGWIVAASLVASFVMSGCSRDTTPVVVQRDSATAMRSDTAIPPMSAMDTALKGPPRPSSQSTSTASSTVSTSASDTINDVTTVPSSDPVAQMMLNAMRRGSGQPHSGLVTALAVIPSSQLVSFVPTIPGYQLTKKPFEFEGQGQSHIRALLRNTLDTSKTIRVVVKSEDERLPSSFASFVTQLETSGSITDRGQGDARTAYYLNVQGFPAAKTYIPWKHVATLTVFVGEHRIIQLREDKVNSSDHLAEVAKYLDVKALAAKPIP